jgi:hypothetical protein
MPDRKHSAAYASARAQARRVAWTRSGVVEHAADRVYEANKDTPFTAASPTSWRDLAHPELRSFSDTEFEIRTSILGRIIYRIPMEDWINWYGGALRTFVGGDGGQGMYMTEAQAAAWTDRADDGGTGIGPG